MSSIELSDQLVLGVWQVARWPHFNSFAGRQTVDHWHGMSDACSAVSFIVRGVSSSFVDHERNLFKWLLFWADGCWCVLQLATHSSARYKMCSVYWPIYLFYLLLYVFLTLEGSLMVFLWEKSARHTHDMCFVLQAIISMDFDSRRLHIVLYLWIAVCPSGMNVSK